jgi:hypothetical protein
MRREPLVQLKGGSEDEASAKKIRSGIDDHQHEHDMRLAAAWLLLG